MGTYKDSGIEWIGKIPEGWEISPFKYLFDTNKGLTITKENLVEVGIPVINYGQIHSMFKTEVVSTDNALPKVSEKFLIYQKSLVKQGDFIFADTSEDLEGAGNFSTRLDSDSLLFAGYHTIISRAKYLDKFNYNYFKNLFDSDFFRNQIRIKVSGVKVFSITQSILNNCIVLIPPLQEQAAIANFLDKRNAEIDVITAKITHQIQTLKDYRQSLITETVTKGLDKTVSYKDSGIKWIGKIPEEWGVIRLKYITDFKTGGTPSDKEGIDDVGEYPWITAKDMNSYQILNPYLFIRREVVNKYNYKLFPSKSILMVCIASIGKISLIETESYSNQQITALINSTCNEKFLLYAIVQQMDKIKLDALSNVIPIINTSYLSNINIAVPPLQEQAAIADFLDDKTAKIDCIIAKKEQQLDIIKEHRKSLIYEYVTGKKRVKEYQQDGD